MVAPWATVSVTPATYPSSASRRPLPLASRKALTQMVELPAGVAVGDSFAPGVADAAGAVVAKVAARVAAAGSVGTPPVGWGGTVGGGWVGGVWATS